MEGDSNFFWVIIYMENQYAEMNMPRDKRSKCGTTIVSRRRVFSSCVSRCRRDARARHGPATQSGRANESGFDRSGTVFLSESVKLYPVC